MSLDSKKLVSYWELFSKFKAKTCLKLFQEGYITNSIKSLWTSTIFPEQLQLSNVTKEDFGVFFETIQLSFSLIEHFSNNKLSSEVAI